MTLYTQIIAVDSSNDRQCVWEDGAPPSLSYMRDAVGGSIESVPYFNSIVVFGKRWPCVAFCDEEGKIKEKEVNVRAQWLWLQQRGAVVIHDVLVGDILVVYGEAKELKKL